MGPFLRAEKLRIERYAFSDQEVKQYFPETTVLPGMFRVVETLYGLTIEPAEAPKWHPDVRFFSIRDRARNLVGQFYLDLYARPSKRGGAWMDDAITRKRIAAAFRHRSPISIVISRAGRRIDGKSARAFHARRVITLFHEFGHGLHHLLRASRSSAWRASTASNGWSNCRAVHGKFLLGMGRARAAQTHVDTGRLCHARCRKNAGRQEFSERQQRCANRILAVRLHLHSISIRRRRYAQALLDDVRRQVAVLVRGGVQPLSPELHAYFRGGYAAVITATSGRKCCPRRVSLFEERGVFDAETGQRFRDEILAVGGSRPALESFVAFRGRPPSIDALLRHNGMTAAA